MTSPHTIATQSSNKMSLGFVTMPSIRSAMFRLTAVHSPLMRPKYPAMRASARMMCVTPGAPDTVMATVEKKLSAALNPEKLIVTPAYDDPNGSHVSIYVVSDKFEDLNVVKRHRIVYKAIWEELQGPIHAVDSIVAKTPAEES